MLQHVVNVFEWTYSKRKTVTPPGAKRGQIRIFRKNRSWRGAKRGHQKSILRKKKVSTLFVLKLSELWDSLFLLIFLLLGLSIYFLWSFRLYLKILLAFDRQIQNDLFMFDSSIQKKINFKLFPKNTNHFQNKFINW